MKSATLTIPEIGLIAMTRGILGAGLAFLLGSKLSDDQRRTLGWSMTAIGALTTIPIVLEVRSHLRSDDNQPLSPS